MLTAIHETNKRCTIYSLAGLLPGKIHANHDLCIITHLTLQGQEYGINAQQIFPDQQYLMALALFDAYPDFCPLAQCWSIIQRITIEQSKREVDQAIDDDHITTITIPIRHMMSRCRQKMHCFGIGIHSILGVGYMLASDRSLRQERLFS